MSICFNPENGREKNVSEVKPHFKWALVLGLVLASALLALAVYAFTHSYKKVELKAIAVVEGEPMSVVVLKATPTPGLYTSMDLPIDDVIKLVGDGNCVYKFGEWRFEGELMNTTTDWNVTELKMRVSNEFYEMRYKGFVPPGGMGVIRLDKLKLYTPVEGDTSVKCRWNIYGAKGFKAQR